MILLGYTILNCIFIYLISMKWNCFLFSMALIGQLVIHKGPGLIHFEGMVYCQLSNVVFSCWLFSIYIRIHPYYRYCLMFEYPNPISKGTSIMNKLYIYALRWVCVGCVHEHVWICQIIFKIISYFQDQT